MQKHLITILLIACAGPVAAQTPAGSYWHSATSNGDATAVSTRVYVFGGTGGIRGGQNAI